MTPARLLLFGSLALAVGCGASSGGSTDDKPIIGKKRGQLCDAVKNPAGFRCSPDTKKRGKGPPEGTEMWCEGKDGKRQGPYRRFPPGSQAAEPDFVGDNVVVGEYKDDKQHGAWWTRRPGLTTVSVQYFEDGAVAQKIECRM